MARIYLHIGTHKTGTTSIQYFIGAQREELLKQGIYHPLARKPEGNPVSGNHRLPWGIRKKKKILDIKDWEALLDELNVHRPSTVVISAEDFCPMKEEEIARVRQLLEGHDVYVIIYLRNYVSHARSVYSTVVKNDNSVKRSFRDYLSSNSRFLNYNYILEKWSREFGKDHLIVRLYDQVVKSGGILGDYCRIIGFDPSAFSNGFDTFRNVSPPERHILAIRRINKLKSLTPEWLFSTRTFLKYKILYRQGGENILLRIMLLFTYGRIMTRKNERVVRKLVAGLPKDTLREIVGEEGMKLLEK